jgi:hypothetical protein
MQNTLLTVLFGALALASCGEKRSSECAAIGKKLAAIEIDERYGRMSEFMTDRERGEVTARWTTKCEAVTTAEIRQCMATALTTGTANACTEDDSAEEPDEPDEHRARAAAQTRWIQSVGGPGSQDIMKVVVAPDHDVVAAGVYGAPLDRGRPGQATLGGTTVTSSGSEDIWVARFAPDGAPRWMKTFGDSRNQFVEGVAVTSRGTIVLGERSFNDVDYGAGTDYTRGTLAVGIQDPVVVVTIDADGSNATAHALPLGGVAESIAALPDGDFVIASRATDFPDGKKAKCTSRAYVVARVREDGSIVWSRCSDLSSRHYFTPTIGHAHVAVAPDGAIAMCGSFAGQMTWSGQVSEAMADDDASSVVVASFTPKGDLRWVRYAYGDVSCADVAITSDGTVAARMDEFPDPDRVVVSGVDPANGPAIGAWSAKGDPLWLRTCSELLGMPQCGDYSLVSTGDHFAFAATNEVGTVVAEVSARSADVISVHAVPRAVSATVFVPYAGSFAFGGTTDSADRDAVIGVVDWNAP